MLDKKGSDVMPKTGRPKICVVSRDRDFASFFSLEAQACSCSVITLEAPPEETEHYALIILDDRVGYCFASDCQVITVLAGDRKKLEKKETSGILYWNWPVSIKTVRKTYEALFGTNEELVPNVNETDTREETVFLFSDGSYRILYKNQVISLTENEWRILHTLGEAKGNPISRAQLSTLLSSNAGNAVDVHICHLRKKIEGPFGKRLILTVRNRGYLLKANIIKKAELV